MANISTVADIKDLSADEVVRRFEGKIIKMIAFKEGKSEHGPYSFQHLICTDDDGDEIKVTLKNRDEIPSNWKGKTITLLAHKGKNDWTGLYAKDDNYNDKTTRILLATATAEIVKGSGSSESEDSDEREERSSRPKQRDEEEQPKKRRNDDDEGDDRKEKRREREPENETDPVDEAKKYLMRFANAAGLCLNMSSFACQQHEKRNDISAPPELITSVAVTALIAMQRGGIIDTLPAKPLWEVEEEEDPEPEPEPKKKKSK